MNSQTCIKCGETKLLEEFYKKKSSKSGFDTRCKACCIKNAKKRYAENRDERLEYQRKYNEANRDRKNANTREYNKKKRASDTIFKLKENLRAQVGMALKRGGWKKTTRTQEMLGCDFEFFEKWIRIQFEDGMSWENHGEWHLDHKKPLASAKTKEEVEALFHYSNYQPLWAFDNLSKGSLFEGERHCR